MMEAMPAVVMGGMTANMMVAMPDGAPDSMSTAQMDAMPVEAMDGRNGDSELGEMEAALIAPKNGLEAQPDALTDAVIIAIDADKISRISPAAATGAPTDIFAADAAASLDAPGDDALGIEVAGPKISKLF